MSTIDRTLAILSDLIRGALYDRHAIAQMVRCSLPVADRYIKALAAVPGVKVGRDRRRKILSWRITDAARAASPELGNLVRRAIEDRTDLSDWHRPLRIDGYAEIRTAMDASVCASCIVRHGLDWNPKVPIANPGCTSQAGCRCSVVIQSAPKIVPPPDPPPPTVSFYGHNLRPDVARRMERNVRIGLMFALRANGETLNAIGKVANISRERVRSLLDVAQRKIEAAADLRFPLPKAATDWSKYAGWSPPFLRRMTISEGAPRPRRRPGPTYVPLPGPPSEASAPSPLLLEAAQSVFAQMGFVNGFAFRDHPPRVVARALDEQTGTELVAAVPLVENGIVRSIVAVVSAIMAECERLNETLPEPT